MKKKEPTNTDRLKQLISSHGWMNPVLYEIRSGTVVISMNGTNQYVLTELLLMGDQQLKDFLLSTITTKMDTKKKYSLRAYARGTDDEVIFNMTEPVNMALSYLLSEDNIMKSGMLDGEEHHLLKKIKKYIAPSIRSNVQIEGESYKLSDEKLTLVRDIINADDLRLSLLEKYHQKADKSYRNMIKFLSIG